ncbi:hypothetical protein [Hydrocarboniphaga effusa]|jgi:hypothetical protein|uniref:hypothetical protein n=1 Tax=Hydrocarboniphaga effusa TaxID=243629 RepID=UPI0035B08915
MNPYAIVGICALWAASLCGVGFFSYGAGQDDVKAEQAEIDKAIADTREAAQQGAAAAISAIEIKHTTIRQRVETQIREKPVYRDCRHEPGVLLDINEAITGRREPAGGSELPRDRAAQ